MSLFGSLFGPWNPPRSTLPETLRVLRDTQPSWPWPDPTNAENAALRKRVAALERQLDEKTAQAARKAAELA